LGLGLVPIKTCGGNCNSEFCLLSAAKTATSLCGRHLIVAHIYASSNSNSSNSNRNSNSSNSNSSDSNMQHRDATAMGRGDSLLLPPPFWLAIFILALAIRQKHYGSVFGLVSGSGNCRMAGALSAIISVLLWQP